MFAVLDFFAGHDGPDDAMPVSRKHKLTGQKQTKTISAKPKRKTISGRMTGIGV